MRKGFWTLIVLTATSIPFNAFAASDEDSLGEISDHLGTVNAWRLIPSVLLVPCAKESPQKADAMREIYNSWSQSNESLIASIDRVLDQVVPLYANAVTVSNSEAKNGIVAITTKMIVDAYFKNEKITVALVCADYDKIVAGLSSPGRTATTRGLVYAVEGLVGLW